MKEKSFKYGSILLFCFILAACSTNKNTSGTRAFHNLTSHYNILFNGNEAYKKGMLSLQESYSDNYNKLLPIFLYTDKEQLSLISSDMDRAIKKATKVISNHSITVKPEMDNNSELTEKDREFLSKKEYNKWVDDSYLLMGKAYLYRNELVEATQTFEYIQANYPKEDPAYEAQIWLARLSIEKKRMKEADEIIGTLEKEPNLSKKLQSELFATKALFAITEEKYQEAISHLKRALENTNSKYNKQRYTYIIAQLYQQTNQLGLALEYFHKVVKLNPAYEMTFNAQINMALSYQAGSGTFKDIEKQLQKMLRDDKNIEFQDQIYYAWGNLYLKRGNTNKAIEYYTLAANVGKENIDQLAITYLTIADLYYKKPEYISSQAYYDSAVGIIDAAYPDYPLILAKSTSLTNLVVHIETVELQDSVQALAKLPKEKILAIIDNIILSEQKATEEARLKEQQLQNQDNFAQQTYELQTNGESSWYFYNNTALNLGKQEFKKKWGTRKLEDNWRRRDKSALNYEPMAEEQDSAATDTAATATGKKPPASKNSREYYLPNIPFTDSAMQASHKKIRAALLEMGNIYSNDLKDYPNAIKSYNDLSKRYPGNENQLQVYYKLYSIGIDTRDASLASTYKQKIIAEYPESNYAKVLGDPEYVKRLEQEQQRYTETYAAAYELFMNKQFVQSASISKKAMEDYPDLELFSNFEYILVVSEGVSKDTTQFINDLQKFIAKYPQTEISQSASLLVTYLQKASPEAAHEQKVIAAQDLYSPDKNQEHFVVIAIPKRTSTNQLMFNIINFNIDNYEKADLKITKAESGNSALLVISIFANADAAAEYYQKITSYDELWRDVNRQDSETFSISKSNLEILKKAPGIDSYLVFFNEQYSQ